MQRLLCLLVSLAVASSVTPVQKVVQMLETMKEKGTKEMQEEQVQYAKQKQFCDQTMSEKGKSIAEAADTIESLEASISQASADAGRLSSELAQHLADSSKAAAEKAKATELRKEERSGFVATVRDLGESIEAIGRALKVLKEEKKASLLELRAVRRLKRLPKAAAQGLDDFSSLLEAEPKSYEFQSGGVISMLEGLQDKFVDERISLEKEEQGKKHSYEMLAQSLEAEITQAEKEQAQKSSLKAKRLEKKATASGDLEEVKTQKALDEKSLKDLKAMCKKKALGFEERQKLRKEELEAIQKAKEVLQSEAVAGNAEKHLPSLLQRTSLAFLRSEPAPDVVKFLQQRSKQLNSRVLSAAAARAAADPIAKVKTMIEHLIVKMQEQANEEATKQGWCDSELSANKAMREEKGSEVEGLRAEMDQLSSLISKLGGEISTLNGEVSELTEGMAKARALREQEAAKSVVTLRDAKEAQVAVAKALAVLKEFYGKALLQVPEGYQGMESGGVVAMMEVIAADFARLQAETEESEAAAKAEFEEFMEDSKVEKASKSKTAEHKANKKQSKSQELLTLEADLQGTSKELDAAEAYLEKLKPDCLDTGTSYAERQAQRKEELKDLETALKMLENA